MAEGTVRNKYLSSSVFIVEIDSATTMTSNEVTTETYGFPFEVIDFWGANKGGAGGAADTATLKAVNAAGTERTISDAMDMNKADNVVTRAGVIDDANSFLIAGEKLRVETASDAIGRFFVLCVKTT